MDRASKVIKSLSQNNILGLYAEDKTYVTPVISGLIKEGETVAVDNSVCLFECGVIELLRSGRYNFLDRYKPGLTAKKKQENFFNSFDADVYLCSSSAVTEAGEIVNTDGNSTRVGALSHGPKSVIVVVGWNKIVRDLEEALLKLKTAVTPQNTNRFFYDNLYRGKNENIPGITPYRLCSGEILNVNYAVSAYQKHKNRIKVILVGENLT